MTLSKRRNVGDVIGDRGTRRKVRKIAGGDIEAGKSRGAIVGIIVVWRELGSIMVMV